MSLQLPPGTATYQPNRHPPPKLRQLVGVVATIGLSIALAIALVAWLLLSSAERLALTIPPEWEAQLGQVVTRSFRAEAEGGPVQASLNQLLDRMEAQWVDPERPQRDVELLFIPDRELVNALAVPGDVVVIYGGLLETVASENELMMVLGHELGHFAHRDHLRRLGRAMAWQVALSLALGNLDILQAEVGQAGAAIAQAQFSQGQERAADEFGLQLLQQVYGHAGGATDFFEGRSDARALAFFSSHPSNRRRVERLNRLIAERNFTVETLAPLPAALETWRAAQ
ncbi:M48 family metallopeptidase [Synechococcus sp. PCC 7336]|uniref:M48 family metallopeptidase n=1 Tax=Synechococcus sp. PCC 7336 TaxID=195250 RepID=UPI0003452068|nr:M48 family metallopeptidase [Synechococcus sp. PCC 7336]